MTLSEILNSKVEKIQGEIQELVGAREINKLNGLLDSMTELYDDRIEQLENNSG